jgi:hypothetical protein
MVNINGINIQVTVLCDKDIIDIVMQCPLDTAKIKELWKIWHGCCEAVNKLEHWWPEMFSDAYVMCSHCLLKKSKNVDLIPLSDNMACQELHARCGDEEDIPSALRYPPGINLNH